MSDNCLDPEVIVLGLKSLEYERSVNIHHIRTRLTEYLKQRRHAAVQQPIQDPPFWSPFYVEFLVNSRSSGADR